MNNLSFGITLMVVGMGGTFITMGLIILFTVLLKRAFPVETPKTKEAPK
jgi:Na+-transporting methylmalonyl-CoA/oxaloacetate decarboxylase gamma subunit